jgi:hypothetical protein
VRNKKHTPTVAPEQCPRVAYLPTRDPARQREASRSNLRIAFSILSRVINRAKAIQRQLFDLHDHPPDTAVTAALWDHASESLCCLDAAGIEKTAARIRAERERLWREADARNVGRSD